METISKQLSIIIADDFPLLELGIKTFLKSRIDIKKVVEVKNGMEVITLLEQASEKFDIVLLDVRSGVLNSFETTTFIKQKYPKIKVIGLSMFADNYYVLELYRRGADGFLRKTLQPEELISVICEVVDGKKYFPENIKQILRNKNLEIENIASNREHVQEIFHEIIFLLCLEKDNHEIAAILNLSVRTIEKYRNNLNVIFSSKNITGIIKYGMRINILEDKLLRKKFSKYFPENEILLEI